MASTPSSREADAPFAGDAAATTTDSFTDVEDELARLVQASYAPRISRSFGAAMLEADNLRPPIPREPRSSGAGGTRTRVAIAVCLGAAALLAWRSFGSPASDIMATWARPFAWISARPSAADPTPVAQTPDPARAQADAPPAVEASAAPPAQAAAQGAAQAAWQTGAIVPPRPPVADAPGAAAAERPPVETNDLAALRQSVAQLTAGQEQLSRAIARLQTEKPRGDKPLAEKADKPQPTKPPSSDKPPAETPHAHMVRRVPAHPTPPAAAPARKPAPIAPMPTQAARQVATVRPVSPPPRPALQIPSEPQPANAPLRPPASVPQP